MEINLGEKKIGDGHRVFFVAEAGVNHNGSLEMAMKLIDVAVESGADAVKFQTFRANEVNTKNAPKASNHIETTGTDEKETWHKYIKVNNFYPIGSLRLANFLNHIKNPLIFLIKQIYLV